MNELDVTIVKCLLDTRLFLLLDHPIFFPSQSILCFTGQLCKASKLDISKNIFI